MPMKLTKEIKRKYHVDSLLLSEEDKCHIILIRNLSGLCNDKSKHNGKWRQNDIMSFCIFVTIMTFSIFIKKMYNT